MANPEHLQILEQGVKVWNAWREQNEDISLDLRGCQVKCVTFFTPAPAPRTGSQID